jgi:hypothetical protein
MGVYIHDAPIAVLGLAVLARGRANDLAKVCCPLMPPSFYIASLFFTKRAKVLSSGMGFVDVRKDAI